MASGGEVPAGIRKQLRGAFSCWTGTGPGRSHAGKGRRGRGRERGRGEGSFSPKPRRPGPLARPAGDAGCDGHSGRRQGCLSSSLTIFKLNFLENGAAALAREIMAHSLPDWAGAWQLQLWPASPPSPPSSWPPGPLDMTAGWPPSGDLGHQLPAGPGPTLALSGGGPGLLP